MKGFTLIEFIIYIGIVTVILLVMFNFSWEIIYGNVKSQAIREVQQNSRFCMEKIVRNILAASKIDLPHPGNSSNKLQLKMTDPGLNPTTFRLNDGVLTIKQGANGPYELINDRVKITNLQFTNVSYDDTPGTIKIQLTIEHLNTNNLSQYEASLDTETTTSLRK